MRAGEGTVDADFSQIDLGVDNGLVSTIEDHYAVLTAARQHGDLRVRVEVHDERPPLDPVRTRTDSAEEWLVAVVDAAPTDHPDVAARLRAGDTRYRVGVIRYAQAVSRHTRTSHSSEDVRAEYARVERLIDERVDATR